MAVEFDCLGPGIKSGDQLLASPIILLVSLAGSHWYRLLIWKSVKQVEQVLGGVDERLSLEGWAACSQCS